MMSRMRFDIDTFLSHNVFALKEKDTKEIVDDGLVTLVKLLISGVDLSRPSFATCAYRPFWNGSSPLIKCNSGLHVIKIL